MNANQDNFRKRILVVANETAEGAVLPETICARAGDAGADVLVIAPSLNSRLRHWASDEDAARRRAGGRLARCLESLARAGVDARGAVGDADPLQAIADGLYGFSADEILIARRAEARSHWLARNLADRARSRFGLPVSDIAMDRAGGSEYPGKAARGRLRRWLVATIAALASVAALVVAVSARGATTQTRLRRARTDTSATRMRRRWLGFSPSSSGVTAPARCSTGRVSPPRGAPL